MTSSSSTVPPVDLEKLLSRDFHPARVSRLIPRDLYQRPTDHHDTSSSGPSGGRRNHNKGTKRGGGGGGASQPHPPERARAADVARHETSRLVLSLVSQTPNFARHLPKDANNATSARTTRNMLLSEYQPSPPPNNQLLPPLSTTGPSNVQQHIPSRFHEVELGDWESQIDWGDGGEDKETSLSQKPSSSLSTRKPPDPGGSLSHPHHHHHSRDPMVWLQRRRNPYLDQLDFGEDSNVCWDGDDVERLLQKARQAPLLLELGVAGQSVARHVYQNTVLSAQRPTPALQSDEYRDRLDRDWSQSNPRGGSGPAPSSAAAAAAATTAKGALHADKDKMEALIEARQRKRAQMAKDKTSRVTQAMGTMALGGGRGRTITSSLMGPGGTERTGRPSRQNVGLAGYESEYIEQLDLVVTHSLVRDLSKVLLREFHRPKLPLSVVRLDLAWQFQIRYIPIKKVEGAAGAGGVVAGSYQSVMMGGAHPGAISKAKLRSEADLSPTEGHLIVLEYCEERPLLQLTKGMACKIVNYYRGDKARCPVSKGGGDRPARRKRPGDVDGDGASHKAAARTELPRLEGPKETTVMDWVGKLPKKQKDRAEQESIDVLPEGVTEILHPKGRRIGLRVRFS